MKTKDGFVMISYQSLHKIKELAYQIKVFAPTFFSYNGKMKKVLKSADAVLRIGEQKKEQGK